MTSEALASVARHQDGGHRHLVADFPGAVHPWIRLWARSFDILLVSLPVLLTVWHFWPPVNLGWLEAMLYFMLVLFVWLVVEPVFLRAFSATPGKWIFSIRVTQEDGSRPTLAQAMRRTDMLWAKGLGAGMPIISQFLMAMAHYKLSSDGKTFWDEETGLEVRHRRIRCLRVIAALAVTVFGVLLYASLLDVDLGPLLRPLLTPICTFVNS